MAEGAGVLADEPAPNANVAPPPDVDGAWDAGAAEELPKEKAGAAGVAEPPLVAACVDPNKAGVLVADVESFFFSVAGVAPKANGWAGAGAFVLAAGLPNKPGVLLASLFFSVVGGAPNENVGLAAGVAEVVAASAGLLEDAALLPAPKENPGVPG